jgi:hypothetical protein
MSVQFAGLAKLLGHDQRRVRLALCEFSHSVAADLLHLERAAAGHRWHAVREFAQSIEAACLQIDEHNAANAAATLGWIPGELFIDAYATRRAQIVELLRRAKEFSGY